MSSVASLPIEEATQGLDALDKLKEFGLDLLKTATTTAVTQGINIGGAALKEQLASKPAQQVVQIVQQAAAPVNTGNPTPEKAPATAPASTSQPSTASGGGKGAITAIFVGGAVLLGLIVAGGVTYKLTTKKAA